MWHERKKNQREVITFTLKLCGISFAATTDWWVVYFITATFLFPAKTILSFFYNILCFCSLPFIDVLFFAAKGNKCLQMSTTLWLWGNFFTQIITATLFPNHIKRLVVFVADSWVVCKWMMCFSFSATRLASL